MTSNPPTQEEWKDLYEAARMFKELAPWKWMEDPDVFGVENPETGETGYCCIMGALGEVLGLLVYLGSEGLALYEGLQSGKITIEDEDLFARQNCLAVTFDDREMIDNKDLGIIKSLGLKFRGRQSWPSFRSHLPGFMPWYLTGAEVRFLGLAIRQAMSVAERLRGLQRPHPTPKGGLSGSLHCNRGRQTGLARKMVQAGTLRDKESPSAYRSGSFGENQSQLTEGG